MTRRAVLIGLACTSISKAGLGSNDAMYVGGTANVPEKVEGKPHCAADTFTFTYKGGKLEVAYSRINAVEYGQKAGRRVGVAVAVSPLALFSKKRRHYLTLNYLDTSNQQQAAVFELGKDTIRTTLATLEARTGKKVEYQDDEARKSGRGN